MHLLEIPSACCLLILVQLTTRRAVVACTDGPTRVMPKVSGRIERFGPSPHHLYLLFSNTATRLHTESCFSQSCSILLACKVVLSYPRSSEGGNWPVSSALPDLPVRVRQGYPSLESAHLF